MTTIDEAALVARARRAGDRRVARAVGQIAAAIAAEHPALRIERDIASLRIMGPGLMRARARDARLRLPELLLGQGGG